MATHFEVLRLLPQLQHVLAMEFALASVVVLDLVLQLRLVLQADQVHPQLLQGLQLPVLQFLRGLVVADQHGVLHLFLGLLLVQLLDGPRGEAVETRDRWRRDDLPMINLIQLQSESYFLTEINFSVLSFPAYNISALLLSTAEKSISVTHFLFSIQFSV